MDAIKKHLQKYSKLTPPESSKKKKVIQVIKNECGVVLKEQQIRFYREGFFLNCHPTIRSEIIKQQECIIQSLLKDEAIRVAFIR